MAMTLVSTSEQQAADIFTKLVGKHFFEQGRFKMSVVRQETMNHELAAFRKPTILVLIRTFSTRFFGHFEFKLLYPPISFFLYVVISLT